MRLRLSDIQASTDDPLQAADALDTKYDELLDSIFHVCEEFVEAWKGVESASPTPASSASLVPAASGPGSVDGAGSERSGGGTSTSAAASLADRLSQYKAGVEERIAKKREEKEAKELALLRAPEINKTSRALAVKATGGKSITDRMEVDLQAKAARQADLKKAMEEQRLAEVTGTPEINQASKTMTRSVSSMQEWQRQRDRKLEERRLAKEAAEAMSVRAAPVILKRSEAMVEAARRRQAQAASAGAASLDSSSGDGPSGMGSASVVSGSTTSTPVDVGSRLYKAAQDLAKKKQELIAKDDAAHPHKPKLSARSAAYVRPGNVADRLYNEHQVQTAERARAVALKLHMEGKVDPVTGKELFKPEINQRSKRMARGARASSVERPASADTTSGQGPSPLPRTSGAFFAATAAKGSAGTGTVGTEPRQRSRIPTRVRSRSQGPVVKFALPDSDGEEEGEEGEEEEGVGKGKGGMYSPRSVPTHPAHGHFYDEDDDGDPFLASPVPYSNADRMTGGAALSTQDDPSWSTPTPSTMPPSLARALQLRRSVIATPLTGPAGTPAPVVTTALPTSLGFVDGPSPPATKPPPTPTTEPRGLSSHPTGGGLSSVPVGTVTPHAATSVPASVPGGVGDWTRGLTARPSALPSYILTAPMPPSTTTTSGGQGQGLGEECESPMSLMIKAALQSASAFVQQQEQAAPALLVGHAPLAGTTALTAPQTAAPAPRSTAATAALTAHSFDDVAARPVAVVPAAPLLSASAPSAAPPSVTHGSHLSHATPGRAPRVEVSHIMASIGGGSGAGGTAPGCAARGRASLGPASESRPPLPGPSAAGGATAATSTGSGYAALASKQRAKVVGVHVPVATATRARVRAGSSGGGSFDLQEPSDEDGGH